MGAADFDVSGLLCVDEVFATLDLITVLRYVHYNWTLAPKLFKSERFLRTIQRVLRAEELTVPIQFCYINLLFERCKWTDIFSYLQNVPQTPHSVMVVVSFALIKSPHRPS